LRALLTTNLDVITNWHSLLPIAQCHRCQQYWLRSRSNHFRKYDPSQSWT
jgi:hypothetical protein